MDEKEIEVLRNAAAAGLVLYVPDSLGSFPVSHIQEFQDEGLCAMFNSWKYAALYNCELKDFVSAKRLSLEAPGVCTNSGDPSTQNSDASKPSTSAEADGNENV